MAKVVTSPLFESISGKLCKNDNAVVALNKKTGKMYSYERHGYNQPNSSLQQGVKSKFKAKSLAASEWWSANKPIIATNGTVTRDGTADYKKLKKAYDAQSKVGNIYAYLRTLVNDQNQVVLPGATPTTPTTPDEDEDDRGA